MNRRVIALELDEELRPAATKNTLTRRRRGWPHEWLLTVQDSRLGSRLEFGCVTTGRRRVVLPRLFTLIICLRPRTLHTVGEAQNRRRWTRGNVAVAFLATQPHRCAKNDLGRLWGIPGIVGTAISHTDRCLVKRTLEPEMATEVNGWKIDGLWI